MVIINGNIIKFRGKSRVGSENVELREQILTLQNLYQSYCKHLNLLDEMQNQDTNEELNSIKENMRLIEEHIGILTGLIK